MVRHLVPGTSTTILCIPASRILTSYCNTSRDLAPQFGVARRASSNSANLSDRFTRNCGSWVKQSSIGTGCPDGSTPARCCTSRSRRLFLAVWRLPRVEPLLDDLCDLPGGDIELASDFGPDHRNLSILPEGRELHGARLVGIGRRG